MQRWSMTLAPLALLIAGTALAQAPTTQDTGPRPWTGGLRVPRGDCDDSQRQASSTIRIAGCTALIQSKRLTPADLAGAYFNRGLAYASEHDYARAIVDYGEAIRLSPLFPHAYKNRGIAYQEQRDFARAMSDYDEAIRQNATLDSVFNNRGDIYYSRRDYALAITEYDAAIKLSPREVTYYRNRANAYKGLNDQDRANADLDEVDRLLAPADQRENRNR